MFKDNFKLYCLIIIVVLFSNSKLSAQTYEINGYILDSVTGVPLSYSNIRIEDSTIGTAASSNGEYSLRLKRDSYTLIASYIGYKSDTIKVNLTSDINLNFALNPVTIEYEEITIVPGVNPAIDIIERAIQRKNERNSKLDSYIFDAYTKGKIKSTEDISSDGSGVGIGLGSADSADLKITGIFENQSRGYFLKPDNYKEEIIARKQTANFPSTINILTGGRIIQNFYSDDIQFFGRPILSPIANNALDYYYYYVEDTTAIDNKKVFQIYFSTIDDSDPGFFGNIFISDESYDLLRVDVNLNSAANPGRIFSLVNIFQQFVPYQKNIYMPIDYRLFVEGSFLGLIRFGFELNSILYNYEINPNLTENDFGMLALKVLSDADTKDNEYWTKVQSIPSSSDEIAAYNRIDSLEAIEKTFWDRFSFLSSTINLDENYYISGPLNLYHFNRVEGHSLDFEFGAEDIFNKRFSSSLDLSYGFSDKQLKKHLRMQFLLGDYRTTELSLDIFDRTESLFSSSDNYNKFTSTLTSLIGKYDFRDYYNSAGFELDASSEIFPILEINLGFLNRTDKSLTNLSDYSFFNRDKNYRKNKPIFDTKINALKFGFDFDFRKYIEDGLYRRRITENKSSFSFGGSVLLSDSKLLKSNLDFQIYDFHFYSRINSFLSTNVNIWINSSFGKNAIPFQMLYALPGNIESVGKSRTFRTLQFGEVFGDRVITAFFEYNFGDEIWRMFNIPFLNKSQISLTYHFNAAYLDISNESQSILRNEFQTFRKPFFENGFSIGHPLVPLRLEFTWKLNHRGRNNFVFGINTFIL